MRRAFSARLRATTAVAARPPAEILADLDHLPLLRMPARHPLLPEFDIDPRRLHRTLLSTYERAPGDFESLLGIEGMGRRACGRWCWSPS